MYEIDADYNLRPCRHIHSKERLDITKIPREKIIEIVEVISNRVDDLQASIQILKHELVRREGREEVIIPNG